MSQEMEKESDRLNFEKAAILRDRIKSFNTSNHLKTFKKII